ncbi:MBL fold metallo-hydrolase, partial [Patescibacteria group bacterium]|nr:MBL fold metallo-hydrolase [Patescibacteria group bacterium]
MKLYFHGGAGTVTGSNYLLETSQSKILIDCGLFQGKRKIEEKNYEPFPYNPKEIDFVLITHAHLDHLGRLPKLIKDGFQGKIFATEPTIGFTKLMLEDSQKILHQRATRKEIIEKMDGQQIRKIMKMFQKVEYRKQIELSKGISVCFREAGHVLGSASIEVNAQGKKIVFSGDLGYDHAPIVRDSAEIESADYVVIESTYGDRIHEVKETCQHLLENVVEETVTRGGVLMIPSFALERTQRLLYHFNELVENNRIPQIPIFVDSPLAIKLTEVYKRYSQYYDQEAKFLIKSGDDIFNFPNLKFTLTTEESKAINQVAPPKIIIAGSGMSQGGRIIHHQRRYLSDPKNTLLFVTYQVPGTLGYRILQGAEKVKILGENISIKAEIKRIDGYSSHADQKGLIDWLSDIKKLSSPNQIKKVFVCHGEEKSSLALSQRIKSDLNLLTEIPEINQMTEI